MGRPRVPLKGLWCWFEELKLIEPVGIFNLGKGSLPRPIGTINMY